MCESLQLVALELVFPGDIRLQGCGHLLSQVQSLGPCALGWWFWRPLGQAPPSRPVSPLPGLRGYKDRPVQWLSSGLEKCFFSWQAPGLEERFP